MRTQYAPIAKKYDRIQEDRMERKYIVDPTLVYALGNLRGQEVIDFGCGTGIITRTLKKEGARLAVGVDIEPKMLAIAKRKETASPLDIQYEKYDVRKIPILGQFDIGIACFLLHYSKKQEDLESMCKGIAKNLKQHARFFAVVPNPDSPLRSDLKYNLVSVKAKSKLKDGAKLKVTFWDNNKPKFSVTNYYWSRETYESSLRNAGFHNINWNQMQVSSEGIAFFGQGIKEAWEREPYLILLEAQKK